MLGTVSAFAYRHRETKKNLCRGDSLSQTQKPPIDLYQKPVQKDPHCHAYYCIVTSWRRSQNHSPNIMLPDNQSFSVSVSLFSRNYFSLKCSPISVRLRFLYEAPRFSPLVLLIKSILMWSWERSNDRILTTWGKTRPSATVSTTYLASASPAVFLSSTKLSSSYRAENISRLYYKGQTIGDVYESIHSLSQYLTNLIHNICFTISFISCLYMFRAHVLIIRRSKLHYTASGIITPIGGRLVHRLREKWSSLNLCTRRPPTGVTIPDAV